MKENHKLKKLMALGALAFALPLCFAACTTNETPSIGTGATNNGNNSASNSQASGNSANISSGSGVAGAGSNATNHKDGASGNQMSAAGLPVSK